jgi:toxin ParE1/3/4
MENVRLSIGAETDLAEIWAYLQEHIGPAAADQWIEDLTRRFTLLGENPRAGRLRHDLGRQRRSFVFGDYVVIYVTKGDAAEVLRVIHGSREIKPKPANLK